MKKTSSGIEIPLNPAGVFPYTSGIHPEMYRKSLWTMRQYAGFASAHESNLRYRELLSKGTKGLSVAFDLPTQMGLDSDDPRAKGEVGKVGVAIDTLDDMETLFDGINLSQISTSMTINATAAILLTMYQLTAEKKGIASKDLRGTIQNDILKEYIARGTYIYPPAPSMRLVVDIFKYCKQFIPQWNTISISGYHIREAGSTAVQEIAFTLANAFTYVDAAIAAGLTPQEFLPRLSFFFNVHNHFLEEVAKFRAARTLWATLLKQRYDTDPHNPLPENCFKLRFHSQVAGSTLTAQSPLNNIVRVAFQAMSAVMGGTQSLHTNAYDEALQLPTSESAEIALRTQQILGHETGVADAVDPFAGSYVVEHLTHKLIEEARKLMDTIQEKGGVLPCIASGFIAGEIADAAYAAQMRIERKEDIVVGVNAYASDTKTTIPSLVIDESVEKLQVDRLKRYKAERNALQVEAALKDLKQLAQVESSQGNLVQEIKNCLSRKCTLGEISHTLKGVWGEY